jgi:hypothetical protein
MKKRERTGSVSLATLLALAFSGPASADDGQFYGLLRERDLTTFGFLRLDMRPSHAVSIETGTWALEMGLGYQNTWALSREVEKYLTAREPLGRHALGPDDLQAIQALPGENYLLDLESAALDVTLHYKFATHWTGYIIASAVSYDGGFLDGTIEKFHRAFGFETFGRPAVRRNDVNLIYDLKSAQVASFGLPKDGGLMDPTVGVRYIGLSLPEPWHLAVEAAVKVPVDGARQLLSTGRFDYGVQAAVQRRGQHHALYADLAAVYYGGAEWPVPQDAEPIPTVIIGYEYQWTARTNINVQVYASKSVYSNKDTDLTELTSTKYQYSLGVRHRINQYLLTFGFTENVQNINNTPDIGFQIGLAYVPHPIRRR